jgi:antitoxin component YwqK of YwqJK toxin-antitoxin module
MCWPETVPFGLRWAYALTGGQKERRKVGLWKEYSSQQILVCEGKYKRGKKRGIFKYYWPDGTIRCEETDSDRQKQINLHKPEV